MISHALLSEISSLLATAWVAGLWQGAALAVMAAALLRLMPRVSASLRHTVLLAVFLLAAILPWIHFPGVAADTGEANAFRISPWFAATIALLWLSMACGRALQLFLAWKHLCAVRRDATLIMPEGKILVRGSSRRALLCASSAVDSPTVLGFHKPRLLLPEWMVPTLTAEELRQIALHECEHLRRGDDWLNLLLQVGLMLLPLNPALVWLNRRIGMQRELACDAAVVASTSQPIAYAICLTRLAEQRIHQRSRLRLALAAWEGKSELAQRVHALLRQPATWTRSQSGFAATAAGMALLAASVGFARMPQFVRIADPVNVALDHAPATVLPTGMPLTLAHADLTPVVKILPASFHLTSGAVHTAKARVKRHVSEKAQRIKLHLNSPRKGSDFSLQPHFLRTAVITQHAWLKGATETDGARPTFTTTEFSSSYVAVPVANGWLVFQL